MLGKGTCAMCGTVDVLIDDLCSQCHMEIFWSELGTETHKRVAQSKIETQETLKMVEDDENDGK